ncbi:caspase-9-like isoform X2 [Sinocyclocheilus anshuiensis]|uniref:caspase-9-like isoform X2 n=1 Tax=Sinocyclocheilus anshuiensis TaxID=1608454 RepID=UPI0007B8EC1B|nr:PREDICTED: caspase-9-like isoform X2 [Sinocyclocheilus anshuiensis]
MDPKHRQILQRNRRNLVTALNPADICDGLLSKGVFTQDMIDEIQSKITRRDQARQLVIDLETRGSQAFPAFLECLRETGQHALAELLQCGDGARLPPSVPIQPSLIPLPVRPLRPERLPVPNPLSPSSETQAVRPTRPRRDSIQCYKMDASPCGICLIINNVDFDPDCDLKDRKGSDIDCDKMEKRFKALNFEVIAKRNLKYKRIRHEMASLAKRDHSAYDCCVVIILSHGTEANHNRFPGAVHGVDGPAVPVQLITNYLNGQNCPSLQGKPKLFFIQACGGGEKDTGFEVSPDEVEPSLGGIDDQMDAIPISSSSDSLSTSDELDARATLPTPSDILVSYSTFPGYVSWRDTQAGSWYVENLDCVLEENAATDDLVTMLMMVNAAVSQISAKGLYKQMPGSFNFLRKLLYFQSSLS